MLWGNLLFLVSISIALFTVVYISVRFGFRKNAVFFASFPLLFLYLGFISTFLSFFQQLTSANFLLMQCVILSLTFVDIYIHQHHALGVKELVEKKERSTPVSDNYITYVCFFLTAVLLLTSFVLRNHAPLENYDDRMYRASTPLYWIQNKSIFRFETLNARKNVFLMGSGLIYMWPNLFQLGEQNANSFYWLAYPLCALGIYYFSGLFTKNGKMKAVSVLLFASTPFVMSNFTFTLVQESWLGLILLCYFYFLILEVRAIALDKAISLFLGIALGILFFVKPTALVYLITLIALTSLKQGRISRLKWLLIGLVSCFIFSGYALFSYQNDKLYGTAYGSVEFQQGHFAVHSLTQLKTHVVRSLFLFVEFPLFSTHFAKNYEIGLQSMSERLGATALLKAESQELWLGVYTKHFRSPNELFSLGGAILLILFFINIGQCMRFTLGKEGYTKDHFIFSLLLIAILVQLIQIRWAENSGIPYRHLLSAFALATGFFSLYLDSIYRFLGKGTSFFFLTLLILSSSQLFLTNMSVLDSWWSKTPKQYYEDRFAVFTAPYAGVMKRVSNPSSFLLVEVQDALDYPLFWSGGYYRNNVYLLHNQNDYDASTFAKIIDKNAREKQVDYIVLYAQPKELSEAMASFGVQYTLVDRFVIDDEQSIDTFKIKK